MNEIILKNIIYGELLDDGDGPDVFGEIINCECGSHYHYGYNYKIRHSFGFGNSIHFERYLLENINKKLCIQHDYINDIVWTNFKLPRK